MNQKNKYKVLISETYTAVAVVEAKDEYEAEEIVSEGCNDGDIDCVSLIGTMKLGSDYDRNVTCIGEAEDEEVTVKIEKEAK